MRRLLVLACLAAFAAAPLSAQSLPDWAAPTAQAPPADGGLASLVPCPPGQVDDGMGGCIPNPPTQVPLDGGLGLLALAGGALAARRLGRR